MKILFCSSPPWSSSGYGQQTALVLPILLELGHEVSFVAMSLFSGGTFNWGPIRVLPSMSDKYGRDAIIAHAERERPDAVITLYDSWTLLGSPIPYADKWFPHLPVDTEPLSLNVAQVVARARLPMTYSRNGVAAFASAGIEALYVPLGYNPEFYRPGDKALARERIGLPRDAFIVGAVAANIGYPSRKSWPEILGAFARFRRKHPEAILYCHTKRDGSVAEGHNLGSIAEHYGIADATLFPEDYSQVVGLTDQVMAEIYRCFDVYLNPAMGEGFGLGIIQAQACHVPVIVGGWTSMAELCVKGWAIAKSEATPWYYPGGSFQFLPKVDAIVEALDEVYDARLRDRPNTEAEDERIRRFDINHIGWAHWRPALDRIGDELGLPRAEPLDLSDRTESEDARVA